MSIVAEAVYQAFKPEKLNYELLGNSDDFHLHWHIFPRYNDDPRPEGPVWWIDRDIRCNENTRPSNKDLTVYKKKLLKELDKIMSNKK